MSEHAQTHEAVALELFYRLEKDDEATRLERLRIFKQCLAATRGLEVKESKHS